MGLSGQTLFANSDGTISVDGSLLTIQGQPVQLAGHVPSTVFGYGCYCAHFSYSCSRDLIQCLWWHLEACITQYTHSVLSLQMFIEIA